MERRRVPLPTDSAVLVLDSGIQRSLATSAFNQRRAECEEAARQLGVRALRDIDADSVSGSTPWLSRGAAARSMSSLKTRACCEP